MTFNNEFVDFQYYTTFSHCENVFLSLSKRQLKCSCLSQLCFANQELTMIYILPLCVNLPHPFFSL